MNLRPRLPLALLVCLLANVPRVQAQQPGWSATGSLVTGRFFGHTATLLANGKVLVVGGSSSTELYDPATGEWTATGNLITPRNGQSAVRLADGRVLVAGGYGALTSAEIYDPGTGAWTTTGSLSIGRERHGAVLLNDGRVLVTGGSASRSAELYDPATGTWSPAGTMNILRGSARRHTVTLLPDGRVLVAGGFDNVALPAAELYDPVDRSWTVTGQLSTARLDHTATLLPNGKVLVAGGSLENACTGMHNGMAGAELYDPATGHWTATGSLTTPRSHHTATLLPNGKILVVGGGSPGCNALNSSELYDPATGSWSAISSMNTTSLPAEAALLANGKVLVAGGSGGNNAELFDAGALISISAASFAAGSALAPESIASAIGANLLTTSQLAPSGAPPTELAGVIVKVRDGVGVERPAPLFYVSPGLINYEVPSGTAVGLATVTVTNGGNFVAAGLVSIAGVAPGLFSANSSGQGVAAGFWIRVASGGAQSYDYLFDLTTRKSVPLDLGPPGDQVYLSLYGTGFRGGTNATAAVGGVNVAVYGFAPVTRYPGLDVVNIGPLPRSLAGRGEVDVVFSVDGKAANSVSTNIR